MAHSGVVWPPTVPATAFAVPSPLAMRYILVRSLRSRAQAEEREETETAVTMPPWRMPAPMPSALGFWDSFYPLRVLNSLTRTLTPFIPMQVRAAPAVRRCLCVVCGARRLRCACCCAGQASALVHVRPDGVRQRAPWTRAHVPGLRHPAAHHEPVLQVRRASRHEHHGRGRQDHHSVRAGSSRCRRRVCLLLLLLTLLLLLLVVVIVMVMHSARERGIGFRELAAQYEEEYMNDMARLGVSPPDVLTRVTEYIPEVR